MVKIPLNLREIFLWKDDSLILEKQIKNRLENENV